MKKSSFELMKIFTKKRVFILGGSILFAFFGLISLAFLYGFDIKSTFSTRYDSIPETSLQIIETDYFQIQTPENWIHILHGHGYEGDPYGLFFTGKGIISYEYGFFSPIYDQDDQVYDYKVEKKVFGRFAVNTARNDNDETGIAIPKQHEMTRHMTFYLDKSVSNNYEEIVHAIVNIRFKS